MAESYAHRFAKQTVASWLRQRSRVGANFKGLQPVLEFIPLSTDKPMHGVYEEYPVCVTKGGVEVGFQSNEDGITQWHEWAATHGKIACKGHGIPTKKDIRKWNDERKRSDPTRLASALYFDIGVVSKGRLTAVFEIKHTHPSTEEKLAWLDAHEVRWFEISADWVLARCSSPYDIAGGILKPWIDSVCTKCHQELCDETTGLMKLGRRLCFDCAGPEFGVQFCGHADCVELITGANGEWCPIHARFGG